MLSVYQSHTTVITCQLAWNLPRGVEKNIYLGTWLTCCHHHLNPDYWQKMARWIDYKDKARSAPKADQLVITCLSGWYYVFLVIVLSLDQLLKGKIN